MTRLLNGIGLGTFPFSGPFTPVSRDDAKRLTKHYLDKGGRYIDAAPTYAFGDIEALLGEVFANYNRDQFFISTSCGYIRDGDGYRVSGRYEDVIADCEESLERLGIDHFDIYMSHIPDTDTPFSETMRALSDLASAGKAHALAVSNVTLEQLKEYNASGLVRYVQNRFSFLNRGLDQSFTDYCQANDIGIVAYQVIERGLLTDARPEGGSRTYGEGDLRRRKPEFAPDVETRIRGWIHSEVRPIAEELGVSVPTLVIAWTLLQPAIALCQMGATRQDQVDDYLSAASLQLSADVISRLDEAYEALVERVQDATGQTIRGFMGLEDYNIYSGSASGKTT